MGSKLAVGEQGKHWPAEPRWNDKRNYFEWSVTIGEPFGEPSRVWAHGASPEACRRNLQKRVKAWKPRAIGCADTEYGDDPTVLEVVRAWYNREKKKPVTTRRLQTLNIYYKEIEVAAKGRKNTIKIANSSLAKVKALRATRRDIRGYLELLNSFSNKQSVHKTILNQAFQMLVDDDFRDDNPVASIKGYNGENASRRARRKVGANPYFSEEPMPFSKAEMDLYWSLEEKYFTGKPRRNPIFRDYTLLLYETAGRPGECLAIEFDSIDYNAGTVTIEATLVYTVLTIEDVHRLIEEFKLSSNQIILPEDWKTLSPTARIYVLFRQPFPKTEASLRVIKVSARALAALKRLKLLAKPGQKLVFIGSSGAMLNPDNAEVTFRKIVKGTPLEGATLRTLRSTKATRIAEAYIRRGLDYALARAREILGHEIGSPVTLENYVAIDRPVIDFVDVG